MKRKKHLLIFSLTFTLFLAACGGPAAPTQDDQAMLATMVAATVEAALDEPPVEISATQAELVENDAPAPVAPTAEAAPPTAIPQPITPAALTVAYVKDGNIYVWTEGGSSVGLTNTGDVRELSISSDGQRIAYVRELAGAPFAYELWVINSDGGVLNPQLLVS